MKDYCGSTGTAWVPDYVPNSCRIHDRCYETIGMSKQQCDNIFFTNMQNESGSSLLPLIYFFGVVVFGGLSYHIAQSKRR